MNTKPLRMFDMFCGGGGSSRGAVMAGVIPVAALDMWELAADNYKLNFPEATVYQMKSSLLMPEQFLDEVGDIDLLLASPECTSHSVAKGNKTRCEESRETAFEVVRFAKTLRPRWIVVENVLQMQRWHRYDEWCQQLEAVGYNLKTGVLDAQYYGVPQARRRFFLVGDIESTPSLPKPGPGIKKTVASILGHGEPQKKSWAFTPVKIPGRAAATIERAERAIQELGCDVPFIMVYYGTDGAGGFQTLDRPLRTVTTVDRFAYVKPGGNDYEMRMLQPPELGAAMGFPDNHIWVESTRRNRVKLIGNAVCPPMMQVVVKTLVEGANIKD